MVDGLLQLHKNFRGERDSFLSRTKNESAIETIFLCICNGSNGLYFSGGGRSDASA